MPTLLPEGEGHTRWAYDAMGRVLREHRTIGSVTKDTTYTYNLDGSLATLTYPSGRLVTYTPSAVGRPLSAADTTHSVTYVNSAHYAPQGDLSSAQFGTAPINYSVSFDSRLRPSQIYAHAAADFLKLDLSYFANNNVQTVTNDLTSGRTLNLTYDSLNRLSTAQTQATSGQYCWGQSIPTDGTGYDRYGNLLKINSSQCTSPTLNLSVNTYNQITNSGFSYDNSGNMTADGVTSYVWNGAGFLKTVGSTTYTYDGDGKRLMNSAGTYYWTTPSGNQLSDTPGSGAGNEYIYFAGRRTAWVDSGGTVRYYWGDHLGTTRIVTDASGNVCYDADYYPFQGERTPYVNTCTPAYKFAGMKFDEESGDYYTLNRYYPPNLGRWLSPDSLPGDVTNPQSLNRYTYALNNPMTLTDPTGLSAAWHLSAPGCSSWEPCYGSGGIPGGGGSGSAMFGYDIFDAISGAPGTYLSYDMYGNMSFGFSVDLWRQTWNLIDAERNAVAGLDVSVWKDYHYWLGLDPFDVPTTGYVVVQRDVGTADINAQFSATGLIPTIWNLQQQLVQLGAMVPKDLQLQYSRTMGSRNPVEGVIAWSGWLEQNYPGSSWIGYGGTWLNGVFGLNDTIANMLSDVYH
jgi:RHS repeat-associated protein